MPPWIKLHNTVLEDPIIAALPDHSKAHVFGLWLLASRLKNKIPNDAKFIGARINASRAVDLNSLIFASFLEHHPECLCGASDALAKCYTDKNEKRVEEKRVETETEPAAKAASLVLPVDVIPVTKAPEIVPLKAPLWNREAAELWWLEYKGDPPKAFFAALKPLVLRETWERVRPALVTYMAETPAEYVNIAGKFVAAFGTWESRARGQPRASKGSVPEKNAKVLDEWEQEVREGKR